MKKTDLERKARKMIEDFVESFGYVAEEDVEFMCDTECDIVNYTLYDSDTSRSNIAWKKYINDTFHITVPLYLLSILHEIGHLETAYQLSQEDVDSDNIDKEIIKLAFENALDKDNCYHLFKAYWDLKMEYLATEWAINFIKHNTEECATFWRKLKPIIKALE